MSHMLMTKEGLAIFPITALILFLIAFLMILKYTFSLPKNAVSEMANLPLVKEDNHE